MRHTWGVHNRSTATSPLLLATAGLTTALTLALTGCASGASGTDSGPATATTGGVHCDSGSVPSFSGKATAFDAPVDVESTHALATQASAPQLSDQSAPAKGFRIAQVKVNARVLTNGVFALHPESFVLADRDGNRCGQPDRNTLSGALTVSQVDETKPASGSVAFVVPAEANLSDYTVYYLGEPGSRTAVAAWSGSGAAPVVDELTSCTDRGNGYDLKKVPDHSFGAPVTTGDSEISLAVTPAAPALRELKPGPDQPNDVLGVAVTLTATAKGSEGFVERNQFQLLDSGGHLCQYNELGSDGETLTSALIPVGHPRTFTLIFWTPRGSQVPGWKLLYIPDPTNKKVAASWTSATSAGSSTAAPSSPVTK